MMTQAEQKPIVLIVDDTPANIQILVPLLKGDYRTLVATRGEKALELAAARSPDVILLDIMMPEMDGYEVCRRLKSNPQTDDIPVIFITAKSETADEAKGFELGAVDYITKPFNSVIVQARVRTHVANHRMQVEIRAQKAAIEQQNRENESLLLNILPGAIAERLKNGDENIVDSFASVSVLFADLVGFTPMSSSMSPEALVGVLNDLFSEFDKLARQHHVEKIKTIGDCYMAVAGVPVARPDHDIAAARMALSMIDSVSALNARRGTQLDVRIGLHSGPVVAGIIGSSKFAYDLWGDTVNTASRMESTSLPGRIQISAAMAASLGERFVLTERGEIEVKGKGPMTTYWLSPVT